jgi:hypothetical protein
MLKAFIRPTQQKTVKGILKKPKGICPVKRILGKYSIYMSDANIRPKQINDCNISLSFADKPYKSSSKNTVKQTNEPTAYCIKNKEYSKPGSLRSAKAFSIKNVAITPRYIPIPPTKGVGSAWNFLTLSGRSISNELVLDIFLKTAFAIAEKVAEINRSDIINSIFNMTAIVTNSLNLLQYSVLLIN